MSTKKIITAYYLDEADLLKGIRHMQSKGLQIADVLSPFPVHGLDKVLGLRRSRLTRVAFAGGAIGGILGFLFQAWVFTVAYPINFGGKPLFSAPSFMPVTFEMTVLFAAFSMVIAYFISHNIGPGAKPLVHDERTTDDHFLVVVNLPENEEHQTEKIKNVMTEAGAEGITIKELSHE